jgi:3'-5' exonuclease
MTRFLVLDIEAIRDPATWTPPEADPDAFAPPYGWRPICIGAVMLEEVAGGGLATRRIGVIDVPKTGAPDGWERDLLLRFAEQFAGKSPPQVVTWNGRGYDLPVLLLRSLRYGITHAWYYNGRDVRYRYSEGGHCDLADAMADYGATRHLGLDGMAKVVGLPGKFGDIDGAGVGAAFAQGRHEEIASYCLADAVQTAFLFIRWQLLKGTLTPASYRGAAAHLLALCEDEPRLAAFTGLVDRRVLLLPETGEAAA